MTAFEFVWDKFPNLIQSNLQLSRGELMEFLIEFALLKCAEQREICADNADLVGEIDYASGEGYNTIDLNSILNSPTPPM